MSERRKYTPEELIQRIVKALNKYEKAGDITRDMDPLDIHNGWYCTYYYSSGINCGAITYETFKMGYDVWILS